VFSFALKLIRFVRDADFSSLFLVLIWIVFFPALWLYARVYPRIPSRVLFWSNEGFRVAPTRVRSYGFCREIVELGVDADVLTFWDHLAKYEGLIPFRTTLGFRTKLTFQAMMAAVRSRAGIIVFQRPFYEFMSVVSLKLMYPLGLRIWLDVDDWIFDEPLTPPPASITFRNMLSVYATVAEGSTVSSLRLETEMKKYVARVEIIPTYPDPALFQNAPSEETHGDRVVFSWIGTLFMEQVSRDVLFLVEALESLQDRRVVFEVLGEGRYLEETRRAAHQIAHHAQVVFLGWKEPDDVPAYLQTIDVGLYCLTTHNVFCESKSPTKLFEYMACGKATVSTDFGEAPRFIEHGRTGFIAATKEDFARCCSLLMDDPHLRREMGANARRKIETEYNLESAGRILKRVLEES
jgi:glycosyltransferase involved in cell wall biosynthesis